MSLPDDVLQCIFDHARDPRLESIFPAWWACADGTVPLTMRSLASFALVARSWVAPARRALSAAVLLHLNERNAPSFTELVRAYGAHVRTLIVDFPYVHDSLPNAALRSFAASVAEHCPNLSNLHFDNIPPAYSHLMSDLAEPFNDNDRITTFGARALCLGKGMRPETLAPIPALPNLRRLAVLSCDMSTRWDSIPLASLTDLHLFRCNPTSLVARLDKMPLRSLFLDQCHLECTFEDFVSALSSISTLESCNIVDVTDLEDKWFGLPPQVSTTCKIQRDMYIIRYAAASISFPACDS